MNKTSRKPSRLLLDVTALLSILTCGGCTLVGGAAQDATQMSNLASFGLDFLRQILAALLT